MGRSALVRLALPAPLVLAWRPASAYPVAATGPVVHDYHGTKVSDPYRWLEDPEAPETRAGHGARKPTTKPIKEAADRWAFPVHELGME